MLIAISLWYHRHTLIFHNIEIRVYLQNTRPVIYLLMLHTVAIFTKPNPNPQSAVIGFAM